MTTLGRGFIEQGCVVSSSIQKPSTNTSLVVCDFSQRDSETFKPWYYVMPRQYPNFAYRNAWAERIDDGEIVNHINRELGRCSIYLSDAEIRRFIEELKDTVRAQELDYDGHRGDDIVVKLKNNLNNDLEAAGRQGLDRSRSRFLVLCFVAHRTNSEELAGALLRFIGKKGADIVDGEKSFLLTEWCLGLQQLQGLVAEDKLHKALRQVANHGPPMFEEWRRPGQNHPRLADLLGNAQERAPHNHDLGRNQIQLLAHHDFPMRRAPLPPLPRPGFMDIPPYPRTAFHPLLLQPRNGLHAVFLQRHIHAFDMFRMQRDLDDWRHRY